jgi:hypothetical protein
MVRVCEAAKRLTDSCKKSLINISFLKTINKLEVEILTPREKKIALESELSVLQRKLRVRQLLTFLASISPLSGMLCHDTMVQAGGFVTTVLTMSATYCSPNHVKIKTNIRNLLGRIKGLEFEIRSLERKS